jgi:hypothetical protein
MQFTGGPRYCETPTDISAWAFPVEPFNTWSNLSIIAFAVIGFFLVVRRVPRAWDLYLLCAILLVNGVGSLLWHGLRDGTALGIEVDAGLLFLAGLFLFWARRVMPLWQTGLFIVGFYIAAFQLAPVLFDNNSLINLGRWASMMPAVVLFGGYLVYRTSLYSKAASYLGTVGIGSAVLALTFRIVDAEGLICSSVPMGTHSLWHTFLSAGAFMGLLAMMGVIRMGETRMGTASTPPLGAPAE